MAQSPSNREQYLRQEAGALLKRLGYGDAPDPGAVQEVFSVLSRADQGGYKRGHSEGHAHGWEDHGRERGCNCS